MKTKIATFRTEPGSREGQESREQKRQAGLEYIKRLREDHEVIEVIEEPNQFRIIMKDGT